MAKTRISKKPRRRYPPGTPCSYCGRLPDQLQNEHVFPDSWYPAGTTASAMLTVPACGSCNEFFGRQENDARILALASHEGNDLSRRALDSIFKSINVERAKNHRDRGARIRRRDWMRSLLKPAWPSQASSAIWSAGQRMETVKFRTESGLHVDAIPAMTLPVSLQAVMVHKWTRGCFYVVRKVPLPAFEPWDYSCPTADRDPREIIRQCSERMDSVISTPGFQAWGLIVPESTRSLWMFAIWNEFIFWSRTAAGWDTATTAGDAPPRPSAPVPA